MEKLKKSNSLKFTDIKKYNRIHDYINYHNKKNLKCDFCGCTDRKRYEFALKKEKEYSNNIQDYHELCASCHRKYDASEFQKNSSRERLKGKSPHNKGFFGDESKSAKKISQIDMITLEVISVYNSIVSAEKRTGIKRNGISQCASGKQKHAGGFLWKKLQ